MTVFPDIPQDFTCQRVDLPDAFNLVSKNSRRKGTFVLIRRNHFQHVAPNPERSPVKIHIIALVLNIHKLGDDCVHADTLTDLDRNDQTGIVFRRAKAVDTGHGRDNDNIPACQRAWVAACLSLSISSLMAESFSIYVSDAGT